MKKILIIGATSAIAGACAQRWAERGDQLFLVGRDAEKLVSVAADLRVRGAGAVGGHALDLTDVASHAAMFALAKDALGEVDVALIAHGTLPDQQACQSSPALTASEFATNATSTIALLTGLAAILERQDSGAIGVITSVAGDRGRPSNYVYGSAKAAVSVFCEGLRARLCKRGVSLTDIRPGFVATPMTAGLALPGLLLAQPEAIAERIVSSIEAGKDIVYAPAFWAVIMMIIRSIPAPIFKRLSL